MASMMQCTSFSNSCRPHGAGSQRLLLAGRYGCFIPEQKHEFLPFFGPQYGHMTWRTICRTLLQEPGIGSRHGERSQRLAMMPRDNQICPAFLSAMASDLHWERTCTLISRRTTSSGLPASSLKKVEEVRDGGQQDGPGDADGARQLTLLSAQGGLQQHLRARQGSRSAACAPAWDGNDPT